MDIEELFGFAAEDELVRQFQFRNGELIFNGKALPREDGYIFPAETSGSCYQLRLRLDPSTNEIKLELIDRINVDDDLIEPVVPPSVLQTDDEFRIDYQDWVRISDARLIPDLQSPPGVGSASAATQYKGAGSAAAIAFRHEMMNLMTYHRALADAVELAAEQVQDKRLEFLETDERNEVQTSEFLFTLLFAFSLEFGIIAKGITKFLIAPTAYTSIKVGRIVEKIFLGNRLLQPQYQRYFLRIYKRNRAIAVSGGPSFSRYVDGLDKGKTRQVLAIWMKYLKPEYLTKSVKALRATRLPIGPTDASGRRGSTSPYEAANALEKGNFFDLYDSARERAPETPGVALQRMARDYISHVEQETASWIAITDSLGVFEQAGVFDDELAKELGKTIAEFIAETEESITQFSVSGEKESPDFIRHGLTIKFEEIIWALLYADRLKNADDDNILTPKRVSHESAPQLVDNESEIEDKRDELISAYEIEGAKPEAFWYWRHRFLDRNGQPIPSNGHVWLRFRAIRKNLNELAGKLQRGKTVEDAILLFAKEINSDSQNNNADATVPAAGAGLE